MKNSVIYYSVGALLYCPANNAGIVSSLKNEKFGKKFSLALCLEDTINDMCVEEAEEILINSIKEVYAGMESMDFYVPKIFIRVRKSEQIERLMDRFGAAGELVTGFIIPKFSLENADEYIEKIITVNKKSDKNIYMMPIFESPTIVNLKERYDILYTLKEKLDKAEELVLNIRVGGNDLCHVFGFRRRSDETIHDIRPVADIFSDIVTVYGKDYVVSGPVWEYYNGDNWEEGLKAELKRDMLCGFTGKTVIHPNQIEVVNEAYKVSVKDYEDAKAILNWDESRNSLVSGSVQKERMNEYKTHSNWAEKIIYLAEAYGVTERI